MNAVGVDDLDETTRWLLRGVSPKTPLPGNLTLLAMAAAHNHADVVRTLLAASAPVDQTIPNGITPLMGARRR